jgi:hypothetical protein
MAPQFVALNCVNLAWFRARLAHHASAVPYGNLGVDYLSKILGKLSMTCLRARLCLSPLLLKLFLSATHLVVQESRYPLYETFFQKGGPRVFKSHGSSSVSTRAFWIIFLFDMPSDGWNCVQKPSSKVCKAFTRQKP